MGTRDAGPGDDDDADAADAAAGERDGAGGGGGGDGSFARELFGEFAALAVGFVVVIVGGLLVWLVFHVLRTGP